MHKLNRFSHFDPLDFPLMVSLLITEQEDIQNLLMVINFEILYSFLVTLKK